MPAWSLANPIARRAQQHERAVVGWDSAIIPRLFRFANRPYARESSFLAFFVVRDSDFQLYVPICVFYYLGWLRFGKNDTIHKRPYVQALFFPAGRFRGSEACVFDGWLTLVVMFCSF